MARCAKSVLIVLIFSTWINNRDLKNDFLAINENNSADTSRTIIDAVINNDPDSSLNHFNKLADTDYKTIKNNCIILRNQLLLDYMATNNDHVRTDILIKGGDLIEYLLVNQVFPFWYGTPWDFDGHSNSPGEGVISCGYFVSTTLNHIGFNIDRYKLAQQNPENEALSLSITRDVKYFINISPSELKSYMIQNKEPEGLYFAGLDCHVGYLLLRNDDLFFIHANYLGEGGVMIEIAENSEAFKSSVYYISEITSNDVLVKKWISGEWIDIITQSDSAVNDEEPYLH